MMRIFSGLCICLMVGGCVDAGPVPGPDKMGQGELVGAATGAGAGAVTGFHLASSTGPGAFVGAGVGAVAGAMHGWIKDREEDDLLKLSTATQRERKVAIAHELLNDHYRRRMEIHPTRDIYPADMFFVGDEVSLRPDAEVLIEEIAKMDKLRLPWSRIVIAAYTKAKDENSSYARFLSDKRSKALSDAFVQAGIEPRRLEAKGMIIDAPVLVDPDDDPLRYSQAIEIIPFDR